MPPRMVIKNFSATGDVRRISRMAKMAPWRNLTRQRLSEIRLLHTRQGQLTRGNGGGRKGSANIFGAHS